MAKSLTDWTIEDLRAKKKTVIVALSVLGVLWLIYVATIVYWFVLGRSFEAVQVLPLVTLIAVSLSPVISLSSIRAEMAKREAAEQRNAGDAD